MNITTIIIFSAVFPIVLVVGIVAMLMNSQAKTNKLLQTGTPAQGRILQLGTTGQSVAVMGHRHLKLVLTVEVQSPYGAPYVASFEQLISELQIPSVQPGAIVELRIDPANPQRIAMAGVVPQQQQQQAWGAQPAGYRAPPAHGAPMVMGVAQPNYKRSLPFILIMMFVTTVPVTVILLWQFGSFGSMFGGSSSTSDDKKGGSKDENKGSSVCEQAKKCCKVIGGENAGCDNYSKMPEEGCRISLDGFKQSAKAQNKTCE